MSVDRKRFASPFWTKDRLSGWRCVACDIGTIFLIENSLRSESIPASMEMYHHTDNPDDIEDRFVAVLKCQNPLCGEPYTMSGICGPSMAHGEGNQDYPTVYRPTHFNPSPDLFDVPADVPSDLRENLRPVFLLFWSNEAACANAIRSFVESFLTYKGVRRMVSKQNRKMLTLHVRIEQYQKIDKDQADHLMAIKWIGNSGSHGLDELKRDNLLDAFQMLEYVLRAEFHKKADAERLRLVRDINKRKGPRPPPKRRKRIAASTS